MADRNMRFIVVVAHFEHLEGQRRYVSHLTDTVMIRLAITPRSPDLAIFVLTDGHNRLLYPLCMCEEYYICMHVPHAHTYKTDNPLPCVEISRVAYYIGMS